MSGSSCFPTSFQHLVGVIVLGFRYSSVYYSRISLVFVWMSYPHPHTHTHTQSSTTVRSKSRFRRKRPPLPPLESKCLDCLYCSPMQRSKALWVKTSFGFYLNVGGDCLFSPLAGICLELTSFKEKKKWLKGSEEARGQEL